MVMCQKRKKDAQYDQRSNGDDESVANSFTDLKTLSAVEKHQTKVKYVYCPCVLYLKPFPSEKALGIQWNIPDDSFTFNIQVNIRPLTKRKMLSIISSIYDPL